jgi:hypothetical protein
LCFKRFEAHIKVAPLTTTTRTLTRKGEEEEGDEEEEDKALWNVKEVLVYTYPFPPIDRCTASFFNWGCRRQLFL